MAVRLMTNRRGMFFTLVAILIITILFVSFSPQYASRINYELPVTESRVEAANGLVETIKYSYVPQALSASSYHALKSLSYHLKSEGRGFADLEELNKTFEWMMLNGTLPDLEHVRNNFYSVEMGNVHFRNLLDEMETSSTDHLQIETKFMRENFNVALYQNADTGAFQVGVNLTINFSVDAGLVRWEDLENISVAFEFEDIEDPLYAINSQLAPNPDLNLGKFVNKFRETDRSYYDVSNTFLEVTHRTYTYAGKRIVDGSDDAKYHAPSFLGRFVQGHNVNADRTFNAKTLGIIEYDKGGVYSDCCGIESLINQHEMYISLPSLDDRSYADWCYFRNYPGGSDPCWVPTIVGSPDLRSVGCITDGTDVSNGDVFGNFPGFMLDERHGETYNVTDFFYGSGAALTFRDSPAHDNIDACSTYIP